MLKPFLFAKAPYWQVYERNPWFVARNEKPNWTNKLAKWVCFGSFVSVIPIVYLTMWLTNNGYLGLVAFFLCLGPSIYLFFRKTAYYDQPPY
ncbi:hypothetical protein [Litorimonas sp. WD9-15]|uniref:hypothetical protein n=1 Tax=Litorimonas sp. WD9-15 TaxID=3418716 RepID=UPI003D0589D5